MTVFSLQVGVCDGVFSLQVGTCNTKLIVLHTSHLPPSRKAAVGKKTVNPNMTDDSELTLANGCTRTVLHCLPGARLPTIQRGGVCAGACAVLLALAALG